MGTPREKEKWARLPLICCYPVAEVSAYAKAINCLAIRKINNVGRCKDMTKDILL